MLFSSNRKYSEEYKEWYLKRLFRHMVIWSTVRNEVLEDAGDMRDGCEATIDRADSVNEPVLNEM